MAHLLVCTSTYGVSTHTYVIGTGPYGVPASYLWRLTYDSSKHISGVVSSSYVIGTHT